MSDAIDTLIETRGKPPNWRRNVLDYNPFDGDFGDGSGDWPGLGQRPVVYLVTRAGELLVSAGAPGVAA